MSATAGETRPSPTPILDRLVPLPQPVRPGSSLGTVLGLSIGSGVAILAIVLLWDPPFLESLREWFLAHTGELFPGEWTGTRSIAVIASLVAAVLLAITIHELGHALGGIWAGFRISQLRIGPLQIDRPFRISLQRSPGTGYAGWVSMFPLKRDKLLQRAMVLVFAGPGINLLCGVVLLLLPFSKGFFSEAFIVISFALGVRELLPIRQRVAISDGRRLWLLFRNPKWSRRWLALVKLGAELRAGVLPESLSPDCLAEAVAYRDDAPDTVTAHALAYAAAFHQHKDAEAGQFLEACLRFSSSASPFQREALMSDAAVFQARRRRRADLAEQWLALMPHPTRSRWLRTRVEAGLLEARGDIEGALRKLEELDTAMHAFPDQAQSTMFLRLLARWRSELRDQAP